MELVVVGRVVRLDDERLEAVDGAVAAVVLVRVDVMLAVDAHRREGAHVLLGAELLVGGAVDARDPDLPELGLHRLVQRLPHRLEAARPRAPRRAVRDDGERRLLQQRREAGVELRHVALPRTCPPRPPHRRARGPPTPPTRRPRCSRSRRDALLHDVRARHVQPLRPRLVEEVERGEAARQPLERHVEDEVDVLVRLQVEHQLRVLRVVSTPPCSRTSAESRSRCRRARRCRRAASPPSARAARKKWAPRTTDMLRSRRASARRASFQLASLRQRSSSDRRGTVRVYAAAFDRRR